MILLEVSRTLGGGEARSLSFFLEPFKTLIREADYLSKFMQCYIVNGEEQNLIPFTIGN